MKFFTRVLATICFAALWPSCAFAKLTINRGAFIKSRAKWDPTTKPHPFKLGIRLGSFAENSKNVKCVEFVQPADPDDAAYIKIKMDMLDTFEIQRVDAMPHAECENVPHVECRFLDNGEYQNRLVLRVEATYNPEDYEPGSIFKYIAHVTANCVDADGNKVDPTCVKDIFCTVTIPKSKNYQSDTEYLGDVNNLGQS